MYYGYGLHFLPAGHWSAQLKAYRDSPTHRAQHATLTLPWTKGPKTEGPWGLSNSHSFTFNKTPAIFLSENTYSLGTRSSIPTGCRDISWKMASHLSGHNLQVDASLVPLKGHSVAVLGQHILDSMFCDRIHGFHWTCVYMLYHLWHIRRSSVLFLATPLLNGDSK